MDRCAGCGVALSAHPPRPLVRGEGRSFHVGCAPGPLLAGAVEEYRAILRKGVRYFVEKYSVSGDPPTEPGVLFVTLGDALEAEARRRESAKGAPPGAAPKA